MGQIKEKYKISTLQLCTDYDMGSCVTSNNTEDMYAPNDATALTASQYPLPMQVLELTWLTAHRLTCLLLQFTCCTWLHQVRFNACTLTKYKFSQ